jgi:hypothetical protein
LDERGAEIVRGAGLVLDHHRLAHRDGELFGQQARNDVNRAARRRRDHDRDRPVGEGLRLRAGAEQRGGKAECQ